MVPLPQDVASFFYFWVLKFHSLWRFMFLINRNTQISLKKLSRNTRLSKTCFLKSSSIINLRQVGFCTKYVRKLFNDGRRVKFKLEPSTWVRTKGIAARRFLFTCCSIFHGKTWKIAGKLAGAERRRGSSSLVVKSIS